MPFTEGNKCGQGRPAGSKNSKTERWEKFTQLLMNDGLDKFERELAKLEGKEYIKVIIDMMEFFQPKLRRSENVNKEPSQLPIPILINYQDQANSSEHK